MIMNSKLHCSVSGCNYFVVGHSVCHFFSECQMIVIHLLKLMLTYVFI
jgi:hypothetical protein